MNFPGILPKTRYTTKDQVYYRRPGLLPEPGYTTNDQVYFQRLGILPKARYTPKDQVYYQRPDQRPDMLPKIIFNYFIRLRRLAIKIYLSRKKLSTAYRPA